MKTHLIILAIAAVLFIIAAIPHTMKVRFEWLGMAALALWLLVGAM